MAAKTLSKEIKRSFFTQCVVQRGRAKKSETIPVKIKTFSVVGR